RCGRRAPPPKQPSQTPQPYVQLPQPDQPALARRIPLSATRLDDPLRPVGLTQLPDDGQAAIVQVQRFRQVALVTAHFGQVLQNQRLTPAIGQLAEDGKAPFVLRRRTRPITHAVVRAAQAAPVDRTCTVVAQLRQDRQALLVAGDRLRPLAAVGVHVAEDAEHNRLAPAVVHVTENCDRFLGIGERGCPILLKALGHGPGPQSESLPADVTEYPERGEALVVTRHGLRQQTLVTIDIAETAQRYSDG